MSNPYESPLGTTDEDPIAKPRIGPVGCGCAVVAVLGILFIALATVFVAVDQPVQIKPPVVAPATQAAPAQNAPAPQNSPQR